MPILSQMLGGGEVEEEACKVMTELSKSNPEKKWAAYQNMDLGHPEIGRLSFLAYGPGCTFSDWFQLPKHSPDTPNIGLGWRYMPVGQVDLEKRIVIPKYPKPFIPSAFRRNSAKSAPDVEKCFDMAEKTGTEESLMKCLQRLHDMEENCQKPLYDRKYPPGLWYESEYSMLFNAAELSGGLILHGAHDRGGDGGAPTFSVNLTPTVGWQIHT